MNIQLYVSKKNFDVQKAERYFKERRIKVQVMDLKKHPLGERELAVMSRGVGLSGLIDREDKRVIEHPAAHCAMDSALQAYIIECPWLLRSPIVRNGSQCTIGYQPGVWDEWIKAE